VFLPAVGQIGAILAVRGSRNVVVEHGSVVTGAGVDAELEEIGVAGAEAIKWG